MTTSSFSFVVAVFLFTFEISAAGSCIFLGATPTKNQARFEIEKYVVLEHSGPHPVNLPSLEGERQMEVRLNPITVNGQIQTFNPIVVVALNSGTWIEASTESKQVAQSLSQIAGKKNINILKRASRAWNKGRNDNLDEQLRLMFGMTDTLHPKIYENSATTAVAYQVHPQYADIFGSHEFFPGKFSVLFRFEIDPNNVSIIQLFNNLQLVDNWIERQRQGPWFGKDENGNWIEVN